MQKGQQNKESYRTRKPNQDAPCPSPALERTNKKTHINEEKSR
jgi:hypothetical protein